MSCKSTSQTCKDSDTMLRCGACTRMTELLACTSFCWSLKGKEICHSQMAFLTAELFLNRTPRPGHEIGKAPSLQKLQHGKLFRRVYLALKSGTVGRVSEKAAIVSLTRVLFFPERANSKTLITENHLLQS